MQRSGWLPRTGRMFEDAHRPSILWQSTRRASLQIQSRLDADRRAVCGGSAAGTVKAKGSWDTNTDTKRVTPSSLPSRSMNDGTNVYQIVWDHIQRAWIRGWPGFSVSGEPTSGLHPAWCSRKLSSSSSCTGAHSVEIVWERFISERKHWKNL